MPYIGRELDRGNYLKLDDISSSFNGSLTTFNLTNGGKAFYPGSAFSILVVLAGVVQEPETAYQINQATITFASAPVAGDQFFCIALGVALGVNVPANGTVNGTQLAKPFNYDGYFYLDDVNNRVGIATATPQKPLHVVGEGQFDSVRVLGDLTVDGTTTTLDTVVTEVDKLEVGANNSTVGVAITQSGSGDILNLYDGSSSVFSVADGGTVTASGDISIADKIIHTGDTDTAIRFPGGNTVTVETAGTERLRVKNNGRIAIGANGIASYLIDARTDENPSSGVIALLRNNQGNGKGAFLAVGANLKGNYSIGMPDNTDAFTIVDGLGNDGTERLRITSAGSVGIGSALPQSQFEVYGTSPIIRSKHSTSQKYTQIHHNGTDGYVDWSSASLIFRGASDVERMRINSAGNVGIGTDNPFGKLQVHAGDDANFSFSTGGGEASLEILNDAGSSNVPLNIRASEYKFKIQGNEKVRIASTGMVGIGTDAAQITSAERLSVFHAITVLRQDSATSGPLYLRNANFTNTTNPYLVLQDGSGNRGAVGILNNESAMYIHGQAGIRFRYGGSQPGTTEAMRISSTGLVGIGTNNPTTKLTTSITHSNGAVADALRLTTQGPYSTSNSEESGAALSFGQFHNTYSTWKTAQVAGIRDGASWHGALSFYTNSGGSQTDITEKVRITAAGKIGINDTNPERAVDIRADNCMIQLEGTGGNGRQYSLCSSDDTTGNAVDGGPSGTFAIYDDTAGEARLRINSAGHVGIDCTPNDHNNFTRALDVNGPSGAAVYMRTNDSTSNCFIVGNYGSEAYINNVANGNIRFYTQGTERFRISNTGLVGVNTTSPSVSLDLSSNTDAVSLPTGTTAQRPTGTDAYIRKNSTNNALEFYNGTEWVEIITDYFPTGSTILG